MNNRYTKAKPRSRSAKSISLTAKSLSIDEDTYLLLMAAIKKTKGKITGGEFSPKTPGSDRDQLRRRPLFIFNQRGSLIKLIISSEGGMMLALYNIIYGITW